MHPYPMVRQGGLFIACVGVGLLAATAISYWTMADTPINRPVFFLGPAVGLILLFSTAGTLSLGKPTNLQMTALWGGIALAVALFLSIPRVFPDPDARTFWLAALFVVGAHLVPLSLVFGQRCAMLGFASMAIAAGGLATPTVDARLIATFDGLLKLAVGSAMARRPEV